MVRPFVGTFSNTHMRPRHIDGVEVGEGVGGMRKRKGLVDVAIRLHFVFEQRCLQFTQIYFSVQNLQKLT